MPTHLSYGFGVEEVRQCLDEKGIGKKSDKESPNSAAILREELDWEMAGQTDCPEGCYVEPDGTCPHGYESAALTAGLI